MSLSTMVVGSLLGAQTAGYLTYFTNLYLNHRMGKRREELKKDLPFEVMIQRHAQGDFSDEFDVKESSKPNKKSNSKSHAIFATAQALALSATILVNASGKDDKLPDSLKSYDNGDNVLSVDECWKIVEDIDRDKNGKFSAKERRTVNALYKTLSDWGENQYASQQNFNFVLNLVSNLNGKIPPEDMRK